jgi:hypothetical protein
MKVMNENFAEVIFNPAIKAVEVKWKRETTFKQYKQVMEAAFNTIVETNCKNWVTNMVEGKAPSKEASVWLQREFVPKTIRQGIHKTAVLVEHNAPSLIFDKSVQHSIEYCGAQLKVFNNRPDLEKWLMQ